MKQNVNVFLPMRAGSERVPNKNTKPFSGVQGGLCKIKLEQLINCNLIDTILVSTNFFNKIHSFSSKNMKFISFI